MAAGDTGLFDSFLVDLSNKIHNVNSDTFNYALVDNTTTPAADTAVPHWGGTGTTDFSLNEVGTATSYTGPIALANVSFTDTGTGTMKLDFDDPSAIAQDASGATDIYWMIIYNATDANKRCVGWMDLGGPVSLQSGSLTVAPNASGFATWTVT